MTQAQDRMEQGENALFAGLNPEQRQAVEATEGPLLVLAGAGTGKTRVLTTRMVYILQQNLAFPSQILAVTFTNKAAGEMRERVERLVGGDAQGLWLGTFHSLCVRILRQHSEKLGFNKDFTILNMDDQLRLLKQILAERNIDEKRWPAKVLGALLDRLKDRGWTPEAVPAHEVAEFAGGKLLSLYEEYQRRLKTLSAMDFGDLLLHTLTLFKQEKDVLEEYQRRFRYILVDEYQDTNVAQYLWLRLLAQGHQNLCCVGDDDQSIYGWRGAEVGNILKFEKDFPGATVIRLERNYRSTADILGTASHLIAFNKDRLGKTLWTEHEASEKVRVVSLWDEKAEAAYIADEIEAEQQMGRLSLDEVAILVRAGFQTRAFEECFLERGMPYKVVGGLRFYERMEIRDAIAYLRLIQQPDDDLAFERIINLPRRGIGKSTLDQIRGQAREQGVSCSRATEAMVQAGAFGPKIRSALGVFTQYMAEWRAVAGTITPAELAERVLDESGYLALWKKDKSIEAEGRVENLGELLHALEEFDTLTGFLEHISLVMDADEAGASGMATISTLHAAKGLEFSTVFLPGWEEGLMPHQRSLDEKGKKGLEEERRLAYVGITRARRRLSICFAANRRVYNQWQSNLPSRFIDELPGEHIEIINRGTGYGNKAKQGFAGVKKEKGFGDRPLPSFTPAGAGRNAGKAGVVTPKATGVRRTGARVFHQKFGYGQVIGVQGEHLTIRFDKAGTKTVIAEYVEEV